MEYLKKVYVKNLTTICREMFSGCVNLKEVKSDLTIQEVKSRGFLGCKNLRIIDLSGVKTIDCKAFVDCLSMNETNCKLPLINFIDTKGIINCAGFNIVNILKYFGKFNESEYPNIKRFRFMRTCECIPENIFNECKELRVIGSKKGNAGISFGPKVLNMSMIAECTKLQKIDLATVSLFTYNNSLKFPYLRRLCVKGLQRIEGIGPVPFPAIKYVDLGKIENFNNSMFLKCGELKRLITHNTMQIIGTSSLARCISINENGMDLSKIKRIGIFGFSRCTGLVDPKFDQVIGIDRAAFLCCKGMKSISIPYITKLPEIALSFCNKLEIANLPNLRCIDPGGFMLCTNIKELDLSGVKNIDRFAFSACRDFKGDKNGILHSQALAPKVNESAFSFCSSIVKVDLSNTVVVEQKAFRRCNRLTNFIGGTDKITYIKQYAFEGCRMIRSINLPSIKQIGVGAFRYCNHGNMDVTLGRNIGGVAKYAFACCGTLNSFSFQGKVLNMVLMKALINKKAFCNTKIKRLELPENIDEQEFRNYYEV